MRFTTEEEPDLTLPEDSLHRARLQDLQLKTISWGEGENKQESQILEWWFEVTQSRLGPKYVGRKVKGECKAQITNREGNRFREWSEALLNREIPVGMAIDTDDLIGLEAEIVIGHRPNKKDPSRPWETVTGIIPVGPSDDVPF